MTYYEWISYFDSLKKKPISDEPINLINNSNLDYKGNIKVRFLNHIVKLINFRLNNSLDGSTVKIYNIIPLLLQFACCLCTSSAAFAVIAVISSPTVISGVDSP